MCQSSLFPLLYAKLNLKKYIQGQLSAKVPPFPSVCLSPASPTEGGLSVHPYSPHGLPSPPSLWAFAHLSVCSETTVLRVHSVSPSSSSSSPLPASLSLMRRDRYGRGGRGGTCLSKPAVENEGSDEGGMLCILNAQTPVRCGGGFEVGIYQ